MINMNYDSILQEVEIWKYLPIFDIRNYCQCNRELNSLSTADHFWKYLCQRDYEDGATKAEYIKYHEILQFFGQHYPIITQLALYLIYRFIERKHWQRFVDDPFYGHNPILDNVHVALTACNMRLDEFGITKEATKVAESVCGDIDYLNFKIEQEGYSVLDCYKEMPSRIYLRGVPNIINFNPDFFHLIDPHLQHYTYLDPIEDEYKKELLKLI